MTIEKIWGHTAGKKKPTKLLHGDLLHPQDALIAVKLEIKIYKQHEVM